jgi:hypothetical protein
MRWSLARCPFCRQGALRLLAALIQAEVIRSILRQTLSPIIRIVYG